MHEGENIWNNILLTKGNFKDSLIIICIFVVISFLLFRVISEIINKNSDNSSDSDYYQRMGDEEDTNITENRQISNRTI